MHDGDDGAATRDEETRRAVLRSYDILDTPREPQFDDIAEMAAAICETPVALVCFIDDDRQFFKAEVGVGRRESPIELSFCRKAFDAGASLTIPDALKDERFKDHPLVANDPRFRFYAGVVLKSPEGLPLGTVCVIDRAPRSLDPVQERILHALARQATVLLELRRLTNEQAKSLAAVEAAERKSSALARIVEETTDFIGIADLGGRVFFLNDAARRLVGLAPDEAPTRRIDEYFHEGDRPLVRDEVLPAVGRGELWEGELRLRNLATGRLVPVLCNVFPLHDSEGARVGYGTVIKDITPQKREERRRAELTTEMAHRMKNTLAMVQAIVTQSFRTAGSLDDAREAILGRLTAFSQAQQVLISEPDPSARTSISDIVRTALSPHLTDLSRCRLTGPAIRIGRSKAMGLSLAIHELATNAAKYGALSAPDGRVDIEWRLAAGPRLHFEWTESGGPPVASPTRTGYGSALLMSVVPSYFDGRSTLGFETSGVIYRLEGPYAG